MKIDQISNWPINELNWMCFVQDKASLGFIFLYRAPYINIDDFPFKISRVDKPDAVPLSQRRKSFEETL